MLDKLKRTATHSAIFALGKLGSKLVGFILLPIYTEALLPEQYGVLGLLEVVELLFVHLLSLALQTALFRWYTLSDDLAQKKSYVFSITTLLILITLGLLPFVIYGGDMISSFLLDSSAYGNYFLYLYASISFQILGKIPLTLLRIEEKSFYFAVLILIQFLISLLLNIYYVVFLGMGVAGILIASAISNGVILLLLIPYLFNRMSFNFATQELKSMILYSLPLMFAAITSTILSLGDRFILTKISTLEMVGLYSLGFKLSNVLKVFIVDSFFLGLPIIGWRVVKEDSNPKRFFSKTMTYLVFVLLWIGLAVSAFAKGVIQILATDPLYWGAHKVVPLLVLGIVLMSIQRMIFFQLEIVRKTKLIPLLVSSVLIVNILLNLMLIPLFNMVGAAFANVLSNLASALLAYFVAQKFYPIKYEIRRLLVLAFVALVLYSITLLLNDVLLVMRIILKGSIVLSFPVLLYYINFYEPVEINRIRGSSLKLKKKTFSIFNFYKK
ncbi:MAG: polysaccharide biosynthesis C-terminal domain-containing protein [Calditrichaeota bacterium]|nr:polysaccharide biosynthesis C-terminal domain-containing protein [Calditrichota bacterium]